MTATMGPIDPNKVDEHLPKGEKGLKSNPNNDRADRVREERDRLGNARVKRAMDMLPRRTRRR